MTGDMTEWMPGGVLQQACRCGGDRGWPAVGRILVCTQHDEEAEQRDSRGSFVGSWSMSMVNGQWWRWIEVVGSTELNLTDRRVTDHS